MDLNIAVICGRIATEPEVRRFASGSVLIRYLVAIRTSKPRRRVDVIPVVLWDPTDAQIANSADCRGQTVWIAGALQRRFWATGEDRSSRIELVADAVEIRRTTGDSEQQSTLV
jgi:single-stranded DNA-binding protein